MFQSVHYQQIFAQHDLCDFDQIWQREIVWFEEPNVRRGGWSGVGQLTLQVRPEESLQVFVKKQENHGRRTWRHPIQGEPTFRREFERLQHLHEHQIGGPKLVFYAEDGSKLQRAVLITEALQGFAPLDEVLSQLSNKRLHACKPLLDEVAKAVRALHQSGLMHRALYPKHIFINTHVSPPQVAFLDMEKSRLGGLMWYRSYFDLAALNRHTALLRLSLRMYFYRQYWQVKRLNFWQKILCRWILRRSQR